jgi:hypothetical protein
VGTPLDRTDVEAAAVIGEAEVVGGGAAAVVGKAAEVVGGEAAIGPEAGGVVDLTWLVSSWLPAAPVGAWATVHPARIATTLARSAVRHAPPGTCVDLGATSSTVRIVGRGMLGRGFGRPVLLHVS